MSEASEREAFEAWFLRNPSTPKSAVKRDKDESYWHFMVREAWAAWQESARRAPTSEPAPVAAEPATRALIEECRAALAEELSAWDIDPPLHHVQQAHDKCVAWLATPAAVMPAEPEQP